MAKKKKKNWDDVKMVISALSVTATLAMWNIFAATNDQAEKKQVVEAPPEPTVVVEVLPTPTQPAFTGKILLGGEAPKPRIIVVQAKAKNKNNGGDNNDGGGGGGAVTSTSSS